MEKRAIITFEDLKEIRPISDGIPLERINPYIYEAQFHDLRPILGEAFYYDFMTNFDNVGAQYDVYRELINGKQYSYGGATIHYPGLRFLIAYFALARFYSGQPINVTKFGLHQKNSDQNVSTPIDPKTIAAEIAELKSMGVTHQAITRDFLARNISSYPLFSQANTTDSINSGGVNFF
jgi:hypothetical protein